MFFVIGICDILISEADNIFKKIALHDFQGGKFSSPANLGLGSALEIKQIRFRRRRESPSQRILQQH